MKLPFGLKIEKGRRRDRRNLCILSSVLGIFLAAVVYVIYLPGAMKGQRLDMWLVVCISIECLLSVFTVIRETHKELAIHRRRSAITAATLTMQNDNVTP